MICSDAVYDTINMRLMLIDIGTEQSYFKKLKEDFDNPPKGPSKSDVDDLCILYNETSKDIIKMKQTIEKFENVLPKIELIKSYIANMPRDMCVGIMKGEERVCYVRRDGTISKELKL